MIITPSASATIGGAENFEISSPPSTMPNHTVSAQDGLARQRISATAVAKRSSVAAPSTVASEKCAMSGDENANSASATSAPPSEHIRRALAHTIHASV